ncbi:MAG TPA: hypothetical protein VF703_08450 [Pyrinomonadaceae bacterium]|jgi:beta-galactosidase/beta-glucuronidase
MTRKRISLDGSWEFQIDPDQSLQPDTLRDAGTPRSIRVPGPWQAQFEDLRDAFADLTPEHVITGISPRDFAADVHAGLFVGWLHHIAALVAELSPAGRLLRNPSPSARLRVVRQLP